VAVESNHSNMDLQSTA